MSVNELSICMNKFTISDHNNDDGSNNMSENFKNIPRNETNEEFDMNINIYRFKFTNEFMNNLYIFSKIHQYDKRKEYKEFWIQWVENNKEIVCNEVIRLNQLGYRGDILDKMFKSSRYYFRKKSTETKKPKERKEYIGVQKELIEEIDNHIKENIHDTSKPSIGFEMFCKTQKEILIKEVIFLCQNFGITNSTEIKNKIKKTYKNRYYLIKNKTNKTNKTNKNK